MNKSSVRCTRVLSGTSWPHFFTRKPEGSLAQLSSCIKTANFRLYQTNVFDLWETKRKPKNFTTFLVCWFRARGCQLAPVFVTMCVFCVANRVLDDFLLLLRLNEFVFIHRLCICWNQPGITVSNTKNWGVDQGKNLRWLWAYIFEYVNYAWTCGIKRLFNFILPDQ